MLISLGTKWSKANKSYGEKISVDSQNVRLIAPEYHLNSGRVALSISLKDGSNVGVRGKHHPISLEDFAKAVGQTEGNEHLKEIPVRFKSKRSEAQTLFDFLPTA